MSNDRRTVASAHARMDSLEGKLDAILALLEDKQPAKTSKAPKAEAKKSASKATPAPVKYEFTGERKGDAQGKKLQRSNRLDFIKAHAWATSGMSCSALRTAVASGKRVNKGWNVAL